MASTHTHTNNSNNNNHRNNNQHQPSSRTRRDTTDATDHPESVPLVNVHSNNPPPLAGPEIDDLDDDDRTPVTHSYPGVDDGFFNNINHNMEPKEASDPDVENINPKDPEDHHDEIPTLSPRIGSDGDSEQPDEVDGTKKPNEVDGTKKPEGPHPENGPGFRRFPFGPAFGTDIEIGSTIPDLESIPDVNVYQHKKTLAQGMMDLALFSANANQLRYVVESTRQHPYYFPSLVMISFSLMLQVAVGIGLVWNATYNVKDQKEICIANKINNFTVIGIFLITVVNVFISAFGVASPATTV